MVIHKDNAHILGNFLGNIVTEEQYGLGNPALDKQVAHLRFQRVIPARNVQNGHIVVLTMALGVDKGQGDG